MTSITVFGSGNMGSALDELFADGGVSVSHADRLGVTAIDGDVVILAVPYESLRDVAEQYRDLLDGKIVVDISNPVDFETFDALKVAPDASAAAELQEALPAVRVVKAFNTTFAGTLSAKRVGPNATTVLVAGDDAEAKRTVIDLVKGAGVNALDAGSLARARELEAIGFLQIALANAEQIGWSAGFAVVT